MVVIKAVSLPHINIMRKVGKMPHLQSQSTTWEKRRLKDWALINQRTLSEDTPTDYEFDYIEIASVANGMLVEQPKRTKFGNAPSRAKRIVTQGDTIVSTVRTYLKASWFAEQADNLICSTGFAVLTPRKGVVPKFISYLAQSNTLTDQVMAESVGTAYPAISEHKLGSLHIALPPYNVQSVIVRYLDYVDRRIRPYVAAKRKLIGLLEEQRQVIIHQAVTRGLDPNVRLKPSGVEWLGDVPEHWEVRRLRTVAEMRVSNVDKHTKDGEIPIRLCNYVDVYKNECITPDLPLMTATATPSEVERFRLEPGDVLITKDSETWNDIGVPAFVELATNDMICGYHLALLRPLNGVLHSGYLFRALQSVSVAYQFHTAANGVTRYGLTHGAINSVLLPLPPPVEQAAIAEYLDKAMNKINADIARVRRQIELLDEYWGRLIADVVTGQFDVCGAAVDNAIPDAAC